MSRGRTGRALAEEAGREPARVPGSGSAAQAGKAPAEEAGREPARVPGPLPLSRGELRQILEELTGEQEAELFARARRKAQEGFGRGIYLRGLLEISNYCRNNCYYCGLRRDNRQLERYRLSREEILDCCQAAYQAGFRTFVLQGGEDPVQGPDWVEETVGQIRDRYPQCAITLSLGEHSRETYRRWREAGADRYLLRHETAEPKHYERLHPPEQSLQRRKECLWKLKELGYQTGSGIMVGSPGQGLEQIYRDLEFLWELQPEMIGIGPFLPQHQTPFSGEKPGSLTVTLRLLALLRLLFPRVLLPATTALATLDTGGRNRGILAGANVVMPNLSPTEVRGSYLLYDNKICTDEEAAECRVLLEKQMSTIGYQVVTARGDSKL